MQKKLLVFATALAFSAATLIVSKSPESFTVAQGDKLSLFCQSDEPYVYCQWEHINKQTKCNLASNDIGTAIECKANNRILWKVDQNTCGIYIDQVTREDVGTYQCSMFAGNSTEFIKHSSVVDVAVPALVTFSGTFNSDSEVRVKEGALLTIECQAMGGYPAPTLRAALGNEPNVIAADPKVDRILEEVSSEEITNPDGTVDVKKTFSLVVQPYDCGKYVKCESGQTDKEGNEIFGRRGKIIENRKLMVLFAPEQMAAPHAPITFGPEATSKRVSINFMANPAPTNNKAIWHINPTRQSGPESMVLQAGSKYRELYEALPLEVSGHNVTATLIINQLSEQAEQYEYYLEATNEVGEQRYNFQLDYITQAPLYDPEEDQDQDNSETSTEEEESTSGMGIGIVIGIIVIVLLVLGAIAGVLWMRTNKKFCFAEAATKPAAADGSDQAERGEPAESEKLNKNNGV